MHKGIRRRFWDNYCPSGVSYIEHLYSLEHVVIEMHHEVGSKGIILVAPIVARLLERSCMFMRSIEEDNGELVWPFFLGRLSGIPVWAHPDAAGWEIQIVDGFGDPPYAIIEIQNYVEKKNPLDRMAVL